MEALIGALFGLAVVKLATLRGLRRQHEADKKLVKEVTAIFKELGRQRP